MSQGLPQNRIEEPVGSASDAKIAGKNNPEEDAPIEGK
jgi:hypothetical protein